MDFRVLGSLEVVHEGRALDLGRPKQRALLARLLISSGQVVSVERLVDDLWEDQRPEDPVGGLHAQVYRLRKVLAAASPDGESPVASHPPGYVLRVAPGDVDSVRFERLVAEGRRAMAEGTPGAAWEPLVAALALWRGPALADFALIGFAQTEAARLEDLRLAATEDLMDVRLALGQHRDVVDHLDALVPEHPLRERFWAQRMLALYRCGRQAEALRAYQDLRRLLAEEVGLEPGPELKALEQALLVQDPELDWSPPPPLPSRIAPVEPDSPAPDGAKAKGNLPLPLTVFIGRAAERTDVAARLQTTRLLTLTGVGGCGKTRLALAVAAEAEPPPPDGTWLFDLSSLSGPGQVLPGVLSAIGVREEPGQPLLDTLGRALAHQQLLIVMDNCEHLVAACAEVAVTLLQLGPGVRILATSREPLGLAGEVLWPVPGLSLPAGPEAPLDAIASSEAVQLFVDRARVVSPTFALTAESAPAVALVCRRLDGLALAIELAAARTGVLSPAEIGDRLDDRFRLLTGGSRTAGARQQNLQAAMEWSHDLLCGPERALLRRLSVFAGGFSLEGAEGVCAGDGVDRDEVFDLLAALVSKSLVVAQTQERRSRYRLLETIRHYARDRLLEAGETQAFRARHATWFTELAERAEPELGGRDQPAWLGLLGEEHDNFRAAFECAIAAHETELALRLAGSLTLFWRVRGHFSEGRKWLGAALSAGDAAAPDLRAKALWGEALLVAMLGQYADAMPFAQESLALSRRSGDLSGCARSLMLVGNFLEFLDGADAARPPLEESIVLAREAGDTWCLAHSLALCGWVHMNYGEFGLARPLLEECLAVARPAGEKQSVAMGLYLLGTVMVSQGDYRQARDALEEGLREYRELGETYGMAAALCGLADVAIARAQHDQAESLLLEAVELARQTGSPATLAYPLCSRGDLARARHDPDGARACFAEALAVTEAAAMPYGPALRGLAAVDHDVGDPVGARALYEQALARARVTGNKYHLARALHGLGNLARSLGDDDEARVSHGQALSLNAGIGAKPGVADSLEAVAGLAALDGHCHDAARLLGAADSLRTVYGYPRPPDQAPGYDADVAVVLRSLGAEELDATWAQGAALSVEEAAARAVRYLGNGDGEHAGLAAPAAADP